MKQTDDEQHLQLLSIFHYVVAGLGALVACLPTFHFTMGLAFFVMGLTQLRESDGPFMAVFGLFFAAIAGIIILVGWALAICIAFAGRSLATQKRYTFCLVIAGVECIFTPFGTVLGVLTIIVLMRPSVKELFSPQLQEAA